MIHEKGTPAKKVTLREAKENVDKGCDEVQRTVPDVNGCAQLLRLVGSCWMKFETGQTSSNNFQQVATTHNITVCKRSQHVGPNNVASCWPTMLRAFARALECKLIFHLSPSSPRPLFNMALHSMVVHCCHSKTTADAIKNVKN